MLRVAIDKSIMEPKPTATAQIKRPTCQLCKGGGYLLGDGESLPSPCSPQALILIALPCGCPAGDAFRALAAELARPIFHRDGIALVPGVEVEWL